MLVCAGILILLQNRNSILKSVSGCFKKSKKYIFSDKNILYTTNVGDSVFDDCDLGDCQ